MAGGNLDSLCTGRRRRILQISATGMHGRAWRARGKAVCSGANAGRIGEPQPECIPFGDWIWYSSKR